MAGVFGGGSNATKTPTYTSLQLQTAVSGLPIPILWGANRLSGNVIDCFDFYSEPAGKGKGGKSGQNDYYAAVILALCEGAHQTQGWDPGHGTTIGKAWSNGQEVNFADLGFGFYPGDESQEPWSTAVAAGRGLAYRPICYLANGNLALGESATIPNYNYEVFSTFNGFNVGTSGSPPVRLPDANFGDIILNLLTDTRYTLNMPLEFIDTDSLDYLRTYHLAQDIFVSPLLKDQEQVSAILQRWGTIGNFWCFWNGTILKVIPLGDTVVTGNGVTYTPNTTPIYALGPDDFQAADKNANKSDPPVTVTRKDPEDGFNVVQLNCSIRDNNYQDTPYRWFDQTSIDQVGIQAPNVISSSEICYESTAQIAVALIGQRQLYIRNEYSFKLLPNYILLEPGDIVTLTEPNIGLNNFSVRIKTVQEDDKGYLDFTAEEFVYGVGTPYIIGQEPWQGGEPWNVNVAPGSVNIPAFIQPDTSLTQGQFEVWAALSGGQEWGGCGVFVSFDDLNYTEIGSIDQKSIQGTLTAVLPSASGLDTTNTLSIDTTESYTVIPTGATEADAQAYRTLVLVDSELMAYGSVTPTGDYTANLTYLERGLYGTTPAPHAAGAPFARIDSSKVFQYPVPEQYLGQVLYFKFPSANLFGNQPQTLAECEAYSFTPSNIPVPGNFTVSYNYAGSGGVGNGVLLSGATLTWTTQQNLTPQTYNFRWSKYPSGTMGQVYGTLGGQTASNSFTLTATELTTEGDGYNYISMQGESNGVTSEWTADAGNPTVPAPTGVSATYEFNADGSFAGMLVSWTPPAASPSSYSVAWTAVGSNPNGFYNVPGNAASVLIPAATVLASIGSPSYFAYVSVQARYGNYDSEYTAPVVASGTAPYAPLLTTGVSATALAGAARLNWSPPSGPNQPTKYTLFGWTSGGVSHLTSTEIAAPSSVGTLSGLISGDTYNLAVVTYNAAGTAEVFNADNEPTLSQIVTATPT